MSCRAVLLVSVAILAVGSHADDCLSKDQACPKDAVSEKTGEHERRVKRSPIPGNEGVKDEYTDVGLETEFVCKEATKTILRWRSENTQIFGVDEHDRYLVNVYLVKPEAPDNPTKVSEQYSGPRVRSILFSDLKPNTSYRFGINLRTDNVSKPFEILVKNTFHTLAEDHFTLSTVTFSNISDCVSYGGDEVRTNFTWTPVPENVCMYEIVVFNRNGSLYGDHPMHIFTRAQDLTKIEIPELRYGCYMSVAVYATNPIAEGEKHWIDFKIPQCVEFHKWDYHICRPLKPENLSLSVENCELEVKWKLLEHPAPSTRILVVPTNPNRLKFTINDTISGVSVFHDTGLSWEPIEVFSDYMAPTGLMGEYMDVYVQAISVKGGSPIAHGGIENHCPPHHVPVSFRPDPQPIPSLTQLTATSHHRTTTATTLYMVLFASLGVLAVAVLAFFGRKACQEWKPQENPLQQEYELHQPLAQDKADECGGDVSSSLGDSDGSDEFEVKREDLNIGEVIGEDDATEEEKKQLRKELEVMKSVGTHKNIVCLVGFCSTSHMLIVEFCSMGDLQNYLRDVWRSKNWAKAAYKRNNPGGSIFRVHARALSGENVVSNLLYNRTDVEKKKLNVTIFDLISLARQVALGMEYLSSNKVVHRDLAARNILLDSDFTAKISDFGLSRDVYEENMYRHKGTRRLPVKWMAIECLVHQMFTTQSDVWSFGILLWELMTLGGCPYPTLQSPQVYQSLQRGERLERPKLCPKSLYDIMIECWDAIPHQRPTFTQLVLRLEEIMMTSDGHHEYLELNEVLVSYSHLYEFSREEETAEAEYPEIITE